MTQIPENKHSEVAFNKAENTGFRHLINATRFSYNGLVAAARHESAFRQELALLLILSPCAYLIATSWTQFALLEAVMLLVLVVELLNSAIEAVVDRISTEYHPTSGLAKDYGSAAVMVALVIAIITWLGVLLDRLL